MSKPVLYLAGPINKTSDAGCRDWREFVKDSLKNDFDFLDPMRRDYRGVEDMAFREIVEGDIEDVDNADIFLANTWKPSWGTAMEIFYAKTSGKRVLVVCDQDSPSPWLVYHSDQIVKTIYEAVKLLEEWARE